MGLEIPRLEFNGGPPKLDFYELIIGHTPTPKELEAKPFTINVKDIDDIARILKEKYPERLLNEYSHMGILAILAIDTEERLVFFMEDSDPFYRGFDT